MTNPLNPNYAKNIEERAISKAKEEKLESQVFDYSAGGSMLTIFIFYRYYLLLR